MDAFSAAYLSSLAAGLTQGVISSLARVTRQQIAGGPAQQALERSLQAGLVALAAQATTVVPGQAENLAAIFEEFFHRPSVWVQVSGLLSAQPLNPAQLREAFVDAGYDETTLPNLDFEAGLDAFTVAFQIVADGEKELQGIIQLGQLRQQTQTQRELLEEVRRLVAFVQQTQVPLAVDAGALRGPAGQTIYVFSGDLRGAIINAESDISSSEQSTSGGQREWPMDESLRPYLETVVRRSGRLPLGPLNPGGHDTAHLALLKVFINLDAGERLIDQDGTLRHFTSAIAHVHENDRLIILGDPGSGKSTLFRYLSFCLANHRLNPDQQWLANLSWSEDQIPIPPGADAATHWTKFVERTHRLNREWALVGQDRKQDGEEPQPVARQWPGPAAIPIQVELRNFAQTEFDPRSPAALWKFIGEQLEKDDLGSAIPALKAAAQRGEVLFLFDGVDEVPTSKRPSVWQAIATLAEGPYGGCRWLAACRVLSFVPQEAPATVSVQTLSPLTEGQIDAFVANWYTALIEVGEHVPPRSAENLLAATRRPRLRTVASNPMLLTIMALVQTYYGTLPDERARLYQQCVETLLLRWQRHKEDSEQAMPGLLAELGTNQQELERLLWEIAWEAHSQGFSQDPDRDDERAADIPESEVMAIACRVLGNWSRAEQFIEYTERLAHLLLGLGGVSNWLFTFPHRTFQEYLAACHLASGRRPGEQAAKLARQGDYWREVLNLAAGTLVFNQNNREKVLDAIEKMLPSSQPAADDEAGWRCVWLAGEMTDVVGREAAERDPTGERFLPRLRDYLAALVTGGRLVPVQRAAAGVALGRLGDPRKDVNCPIPATVLIPAGPFRMGSDKKNQRSPYYDELTYGDEEPSHEVTYLNFDYRIGQYPVTVAQYRLFVEDDGYNSQQSGAYWQGGGLEWLKQSGPNAPRYWDDPQWTVDNLPVVGVTWYEAVAYCAWLNAHKPAGRGAFRLPSEAMWEKAARGTDGRRWPWGNDFDKTKLNSDGGRIGRTSAVGIFPAGKSPYDVYDCAGNVLEWCSGPGYGSGESYPLTPRSYAADLALPAGTRALRGGSWVYVDQVTRAAYRAYYTPDAWLDLVGFRVAELLSDPEF